MTIPRRSTETRLTSKPGGEIQVEFDSKQEGCNLPFADPRWNEGNVTWIKVHRARIEAIVDIDDVGSIKRGVSIRPEDAGGRLRKRDGVDYG